MLAFLGCTPSITVLQVRVSIATPPSCSSRQATPSRPKVRDFFPAAPRILDSTFLGGKHDREGHDGQSCRNSAYPGTTFEQPSAPAVRFRLYANTLGSNRGRKRSIEIRAGR